MPRDPLPDMPSVIFMGSKPGASVALQTLVERRWDIRAVVVAKSTYQPWTAGPTLEEVARHHGLPVHLQKDLPREPADWVLSYMFRNLVRPDVLALARRAALNFHAAPLPEFGGFGTYNRAVLERHDRFGATCHYMDEGFDSGDILEVGYCELDPAAETALSVERKAQETMVRLFHRFCALAESGAPLPRAAQDPARRGYRTAEELADMKRIPEGADAETVDRYARAFWYPPYEGAWTEVGGVRVEITPRAAMEDTAAALHAGDHERLLAVSRACAASAEAVG